MAVSNIDIDVSDEKFQAFVKVFEAHKKAVDSLPAAWKSATQSAAGAKTEFEKASDALAKQAESAVAINTSVTKLTQTSGALSHHWHLMKLNTAGVASNIKDMTASLTSWAGTLAKVTGIGLGAAVGVGGMAAAGFWGMDRMGQGVMSKRMRARGLGTSIGGVASFETAFGRLGDTSAMLNFANVAKTNVSSDERKALGNIGITQAQIDKLPTDELEALAIRKLKEKSNSIRDDNRYFGTMATLGFTDQHSLNVIRHTSGSEIEGLERQFQTDKPKMNIGEDAAKRWVDFAQEVSRVATTLENKFETRLAALGEPLSKLSENLGKAAGVFIDKDLGPWIDKLAGGLDWLAGEAGNEKTKAAIGGFFEDIKAAAELMAGTVHKLAEVGKWLGIVTPAQASLGMPPGSPGSPPGGASPEAMEHGGGAGRGDRGGGEGPGGGQSGRGEYNVKKAYDLLKSQGATDEEARVLAAIAQPESGGNPRAHNPRGSDNSYGLWQINMLGAMGPARRAKYGLSSNEDLYDPATNARVAIAMHRSAHGYNDWTTYSSGKYRKYLGGADQKAVDDHIGEHPSKHKQGLKPNMTPDEVNSWNKDHGGGPQSSLRTNQPKVAIRQMPGSDIWAQMNAVNFGRA